MMLLLQATICTLLTIIQPIEGYRVITIHDQWISVDDNNSNISKLYATPCVDDNCYYSLNQALSNLTNNVLINVTTNIRLSSIIQIVGLANISIRGYQNPTVNCNSNGGLHFTSCYNLTIEGVTWEGCGRRSISNDDTAEPALKLHNSTNIVIEKCTFQHSLGQVVVLLGVSGSVNFNQCNFLSNRQYKSNGATIHFSSPSQYAYIRLYLTIIGCNFSYNEGAESVLYFGQTATKVQAYLYLQNSNFYQNKGVPLYLSNQTLYVNGNVDFKNNFAENGGGIFISNYSNVVFYESAKVNFINNTANHNGGAIFITNHSSILFTASNQHYVKALHADNQTILFDYNRANKYGGAIYAYTSNITFGEGVIVAFNKNKAVVYGGGAISIHTNSFVTFEQNCRVKFCNNKAAWISGAVNIMNSSFMCKESSVVVFNDNIADVGGAINIYYSSNIILNSNSTVTFSDNKAKTICGAMYISNSTVAFERNSTVKFNYNHANLSGGAVCFDISKVTFKGNSTTVFKKNSAYSGGAVFILGTCTFEESSKVLFSDNTAYFGGAMFIESHSVVTFKENSVMTFYNNRATISGGAAFIVNSSITFEGYSTVKFDTNKADNGGAVSILYSSHATFKGNSVITFCGNSANKICGAMLMSASTVTIEGSTNIKFNYNHGNVSGGALCSDNFNITFGGNSAVTFNGNKANIGGAIIFTSKVSETVGAVDSSVTFDGNSVIMLNNNRANRGGAMFTRNVSIFQFKGNSKILIYNNKAVDYGGALCIDSSSITFEENSRAVFNNNRADNGGAMLITNTSIVLFKGKSAVTLYNNKGTLGVVFIILSVVSFEGSTSVTFYENTYGGAMVMNNSTVTFDSNSTVTFKQNEAKNCGGAVISQHSNIIIRGNCAVKFISNKAFNGGGAICITNNSNIRFTGISFAIFENNIGEFSGGAISTIGSAVIFEGHSTVTFNSNGAVLGGALYIGYYSNVTFTGNSTVTFNINEALNGGAFCTQSYSNAILEGNTTVIFSNNKVVNSGAAMCNLEFSNFIFQGNLTVSFITNNAENGGAMSIYNSTVTFVGSSMVEFIHNQASIDGGAVYINNSSITFEGNCAVTFKNNRAIHGYGGAVYIHHYPTPLFKQNFTENLVEENEGTIHFYHSNVTFQENSIVTFVYNEAYNGGAMYSYNKAHIVFQGKSTTTFKYNTAIQGGGVLYSYAYCGISFKENSNVTFSHNIALHGGAIYLQLNSYIKFEGHCAVEFLANTALEYGGAINSFVNTSIMFTDNAGVTFKNNKAKNGGAVYSDSTYVTITERSKNSAIANITFAKNSFVNFTKNAALQDGGSIYLNDHSNFALIHNSKVSFYHNIASDYGAAIYAKFKSSAMNFNVSHIYFMGNSAGTINKFLYINVVKSCDRSCFFNNIKGISQKSLPVATSPNKLVLYNPARCINGTYTQCDTYFINNVMLGQAIMLNACLFDYYNQPSETAQFLVTGIINQDFKISSSKYISISCNHVTQGITITGDLNENNSYNYSILLSLYTLRISESRIISVNLQVELSQCHPGFLYSNESQKCECYNNSDIVSCSGSSSTIKRGYWFGTVTKIYTVTICPDNYCNFTCCEITNGIHHLSPVRENQCRSHRSGVACGNCEKGYTLSFDYTDCIKVKKCSSGQTLLVTVLSLLYWLFIVVSVFAMMHFKVAIGSLYAIIYYYSVLDVLLSQEYFILSGLYTAVSIMSSLAKLTPQFLGRLCLMRNMSGIDQQFIHYIHPAVILFILIIITVLARRSHKISSLISRGIIHFICFLLLLSYTSIATTSLLLMRSLTFMDVDKVYTYLSPDIEYFHGRHLAYMIMAMIFMIVIVIGLPLLLTIEPLLNSKINFIKLKPLLDQFQGCYKDKYRCFAGYYMICRIVIFLLVIVRIFDKFTTQYLLLVACALMELIHLIMRPYISTIHNIFDGIILQLIVIISILPLVELVDNYNATLVVVITYFLIIMPLASFITIKFILHKNEINIAIKGWCKWCSRQREHNEASSDDMEMPINEIGTITIDDSVRKSTMVVQPM